MWSSPEATHIVDLGLLDDFNNFYYTATFLNKKLNTKFVE